MARKLRKRRVGLAKAELSLTPLIDTALTLLIIFMITAPMMHRNAIKVTLPEGTAKEAENTKQELIVYIDGKEKIYFNEKEMTLDSLIPEIREHIGTSNQQTVFVRADKSVQYGKVINIVDRIKVVGGVSYVALATQNPVQV